jgi:signal peptidase II
MIGDQVLLDFAILAVILALAITFARQKKMHRFFSVLGAVWVVIVDRYVKRLVAANLELGETAELLPGLFRLRRVHNYGAAWSSLSGARWLLIILTSVGLAVMAWLFFRIVRHPLGMWSLALVIGGGVGNLIDRVRLGYVIDMLETEFISFPVFNVADIFVTCGAAAAAVYYLKYYEKYDAKNWEKKNDGTDHPDDGKLQ